MLRLENISVKIKEKKILNTISAVFHPGKMNLIIGPNGSGKSTLIKVASKQILAHEGSVYYEKKQLAEQSYQQLAKIRAVLSQHTKVAFPMKAWEVVMMGRYPHFTSNPTKTDEQAAMQAMEYFDVIALANRDYATLSGGEKQRVHFARVLSQLWNPVAGQLRYLLLDEPLTFLDIHFQHQFMHKLLALERKEDWVVVGVVHDLNIAARFADYILLLNEGNVLAQGSPDDVLTVKNIEQAFKIQPTILHQGAKKIISF